MNDFIKLKGCFQRLNDFTDSKGHNSEVEKKCKFKPFFTASVLNIKKLVKFMSLNPSILDPITLIFFIFQRLTRYLAYLRPIFIHSSLFFSFITTSFFEDFFNIMDRFGDIQAIYERIEKSDMIVVVIDIILQLTLTMNVEGEV